MKRTACLFLLLTLVLAIQAAAQNRQGVTVAGMVLDRQSRPAPGLNVCLVGSHGRHSAVTDKNGQFLFSDIAPGQVYDLEIYWGRDLMYRQPKRIDRDTNIGSIRL